MCFSVNVNLVKEELEKRFDATLIDRDKYRPSYYYHAFSLPDLPVICSGDNSKIKLFRWGLIPSATRDLNEAADIRLKTFNARAESIDTKPSFSASFHSKRCIIPVRGFYEWQHTGKQKIPWYIYHSENEIITLAGIYDQWVESSTGEIFNTFSIITTEANDLLAKIHNSAKRMPVVLDSSSSKLWLDQASDTTSLKNVLRPYEDGILSAYTIGPLVNDKYADRNTPEVIKPYQYYSQNSLF
jgi:putative SOS response-associated peptidase YedK